MASELLQRDIDLIRLAREIAIDHEDIDIVLTRYQLSYDAWYALLQLPRFAALLANEEEAWRSAKNTKERVKYKAAALIEGYLEAAQASLHSSNEGLVAKTGLAKLVAGFAGLNGEEGRGFGASGGGSGFSITINLGDRTLNVGSRHQKQLENDENDEEIEDFEEITESAVDDDVRLINADLGEIA